MVSKNWNNGIMARVMGHGPGLVDDKARPPNKSASSSEAIGPPRKKQARLFNGISLRSSNRQRLKAAPGPRFSINRTRPN